MRYIIVGDTHIRHNPPVFRNDGFYASLRDKLGQIRRLSEEHSASVIVLGDFFDRAVQGELERIVADNIDSIRGWHTLIGNHDTRSSDGSLYGTSLGLLVSLGIISIMPDDGLFDVFHYHDRNDYGKRPFPRRYALVHDYILPEGVKAMYEHRKCAENGYSYAFIGHYHLPFDISIGHTRFVNPGSLMRLTADEIRLDRTPEVLLLDTDTDTLTHIPLRAERLSDIVSTGYEERKEREFESRFVDLLIDTNASNGNGDIVSLLRKNDVSEDIVSYIAEKVRNLTE